MWNALQALSCFKVGQTKPHLSVKHIRKQSMITQHCSLCFINIEKYEKKVPNSGNMVFVVLNANCRFLHRVFRKDAWLNRDSYCSYLPVLRAMCGK